MITARFITSLFMDPYRVKRLMPLSFTIAVLYNKEKGRSEYHKEHPTFSIDRISEN